MSPPHFPNQKYTYYQISLLYAHITIGYFRRITYFFIYFLTEKDRQDCQSNQKTCRKRHRHVSLHHSDMSHNEKDSK